jgi:hypothetical protein
MMPNSPSTAYYGQALKTAVLNINAMLWFKKTISRIASYDKGKFCCICFDDKMTNVLTKCAHMNRHESHFIVDNHDVADNTVVWHRPKEVEGIPNIIHADAVCNNIDVMCGECFSDPPGNRNRVGYDHRPWANPGTYCFRAHCVEHNEVGDEFTIGDGHLSRVVCPFQFNSYRHSKVYRNSPCKHYHFVDSGMAKLELVFFTKALIAVCPDIFFNLNMKSLCFMFGCYMEEMNNDFDTSRITNSNVLSKMIDADPLDTYNNWMFLFASTEKEVYDAYGYVAHHYDDCNIINPIYDGAAFTREVWDPDKGKNRKTFHTRLLGAGRGDNTRPVYANLNILAESVHHRYSQIPGDFPDTFYGIVHDVDNVESVMVKPVNAEAFQYLWRSLAGSKESRGIAKNGISMMRLYALIDVDNIPPPVFVTGADKECVYNEVSTNAASSSHGPPRYVVDRWEDAATETDSAPDAVDETTPDAVDVTTPDAVDASMATVSSDGRYVTFNMLMSDMLKKGTHYTGCTHEGHLICFIPQALPENTETGVLSDTKLAISTEVTRSCGADGVVIVSKKTTFAFSGTHFHHG